MLTRPREARPADAYAISDCSALGLHQIEVVVRRVDDHSAGRFCPRIADLLAEKARINAVLASLLVRQRIVRRRSGVCETPFLFVWRIPPRWCTKPLLRSALGLPHRVAEQKFYETGYRVGLHFWRCRNDDGSGFRCWIGRRKQRLRGRNVRHGQYQTTNND